MTSKEGREEALKRISQCILQDRNASYGDPEDNFREIADLWNAFGFSCDTHDVSILMILMKMARIKDNPGHLDSWIDIAGYALCQAGMLIRESDMTMLERAAAAPIKAPSSAPQESTAASHALAPQTARTSQEWQKSPGGLSFPAGI